MTPAFTRPVFTKIPAMTNLCLSLNLLREFIVDALSVERNHILVRVGVVGGPSERKLPPRDLQQVSVAPLYSPFSTVTDIHGH